MVNISQMTLKYFCLSNEKLFWLNESYLKYELIKFYASLKCNQGSFHYLSPIQQQLTSKLNRIMPRKQKLYISSKIDFLVL